MGYYTFFQLEAVDGPKDKIEVFNNFLAKRRELENFLEFNKDEMFFEHWAREELTQLEDIDIIIEVLKNGGSFKWYEHSRDMRTFSKLFPNLYFTISGEGEEQPDLWREKFHNGKGDLVAAEITYPDFEEEDKWT